MEELQTLPVHDGPVCFVPDCIPRCTLDQPGAVPARDGNILWNRVISTFEGKNLGEVGLPRRSELTHAFPHYRNLRVASREVRLRFAQELLHSCPEHQYRQPETDQKGDQPMIAAYRPRATSPADVTVASAKLESPQITFVLGGDLCPNGLLNIFPATPKAKCGIPFPKRRPITKYHNTKSCRGTPQTAAYAEDKVDAVRR